MAELKPCPFCGKIPKIKWYNGDVSIRKYQIECTNPKCLCEAKTECYGLPDTAIEAWNRRANNEV